jgi:GT2 family glycosyltransferase
VNAAPPVTVILVNWNGREVTLDCLASLRRATYPALRVLLVDNASTDGSVQEVRSRFPEVEVLEMEANLRFAGGNNAGMRHALESAAEYLVLLNNDTVVDPGFLEPLVARMASDPGTGMVAPKIFYHATPEVIWFAGGAISMWTGTMRHIGIREVDRGQHDRPGDIEYATGCCVMVRSSVVRRVGMLDESFFIYGEDADWSMRVRRAGYSVLYEPASKVWHKISVSSGGHLSAFKLRNKFLSNFRFFVRHASWYHWLVFPWMNIVVNGAAALKYFKERKT